MSLGFNEDKIFTEDGNIENEYTKKLEFTCPRCGSTNIKSNYFIGVNVKHKELGKTITELVQSDAIKEYGTATPFMEVYCDDCGNKISRQVDLSMFGTKDMFIELQDRNKRFTNILGDSNNLGDAINKLSLDMEDAENEYLNTVMGAATNDIERDLANRGIRWENDTVIVKKTGPINPDDVIELDS